MRVRHDLSPASLLLLGHRARSRCSAATACTSTTCARCRSTAARCASSSAGARPCSRRCSELLAAERRAASIGSEPLPRFADRARRLREALRALLHGLKAEGRRIAGYGAAAKGTTLLSYLRHRPPTARLRGRPQRYKHGRYMPGSRLPILPAEQLLEDQPDDTLLLPWNFARRDPGAAGRIPRRAAAASSSRFPSHASSDDVPSSNRISASRRAAQMSDRAARPSRLPLVRRPRRALVLRGGRRPGASGQAGAHARGGSGLRAGRHPHVLLRELRLRLERRLRSRAHALRGRLRIDPGGVADLQRLPRAPRPRPDRALRPARQEGGRGRLRPGRVHHHARRDRRQSRATASTG